RASALDRAAIRPTPCSGRCDQRRPLPCCIAEASDRTLPRSRQFLCKTIKTAANWLLTASPLPWLPRPSKEGAATLPSSERRHVHSGEPGQANRELALGRLADLGRNRAVMRPRRLLHQRISGQSAYDCIRLSCARSVLSGGALRFCLHRALSA